MSSTFSESPSQAKSTKRLTALIDNPLRRSLTSLRRASSRRYSTSSTFMQFLSPTKDKMDPELRDALAILELQSLSELEERFLNTDAFLRPWTSFRDTFLLLQKGVMPPAEGKGNVTNRDVLLFYTYFDEGEKRYEPLSDPFSVDFTTDSSKYGVINKSLWRAEEHEKLLYVWLLQTFKVGKKSNPYGFKYFEYRDPCSAWEKAILPIVNAVRNDYSVRGRYHYGRFAKLVESLSPSPLAFPTGNVESSARRTYLTAPSSNQTVRTSDLDPITKVLRRKSKPPKTFWAEDERELKLAYPQYGFMVERPNVKVSLKDWVKDQRERAHHRRTLEDLEGGYEAMAPSSPLGKFNFDLSPAKSKDAAHNSVDTSDQPYNDGSPERAESSKLKPSSSHATPRKNMKRRESDGLYSTIRESNPFEYESYSSTKGTEKMSTEPYNGNPAAYASPYSSPDQPEGSRAQNWLAKTDHTPSSGPVRVHSQRGSKEPEQTTPQNKGRIGNKGDTIATARVPSYEGTGYGDSPSLTSPTPTPLNEPIQLENPRKRATRIPSPSHTGRKETPRRYHPVVERSSSRGDSILAAYENTPPPPIPPKNPKRYSSIKGHVNGSRSQQLRSEAAESLMGPRIISKENIRAAVTLSRENSTESLANEKIDAPLASPASVQSTGSVERGFAGLGGRGMNTGEFTPAPTLPAYNSHMFPRIGSPAGGTLMQRRFQQVQAYNMARLDKNGKEQK